MLKTSNLTTEAELIKISFQHMYVEHGRASEPRTGLHASSLLVPESEWCTRKHVLINLFPEQARQPELHSWDWKMQDTFLHGWELHKKWQMLFEKHARVVYSKVDVTMNGFNQYQEPVQETVTVNQPELDLTHYDKTREIYFSPDAIIEFGSYRYVIEIKGIKQETFEQLTDDLETAIQVSDVVAKARVQANLYMHFLDLQRAILLIENKNDQRFKVWVIEKDFSLIETQRDRWYAVKASTAITRNHGLSKLKPRVCASINAPLAKKCPMKDVCFKSSEE